MNGSNWCLVAVGVLVIAGACSPPTLAGSGRWENLSPQGVVGRYFNYIAQHQCPEARAMRPSYSIQDCETVQDVTVHRLQEYPSDQEAAAVFVFVDVIVSRTGASTPQQGCFRLSRQTGRWLIGDLGPCPGKSPVGLDLRVGPEQGAPSGSAWPRAGGPEPADGLRPTAAPEVVERGLPPPPPTTSATDAWSETPHEPPVGRRPSLRRGGAEPYSPVVAPQEFGSAAILRECWKPEQLTGPSARIEKPVPIDRSRPPAAAIDEARMGLASLPQERRASIREVEPRDPDDKLVALTFDLCEQANERAGYQAEIVNYLRARAVPATFFAGGKWMKSHPEQTMQLMADPLFEVGNHAWTHGNMRVLKGAEMRDQILWTQAQYAILRSELENKSCVAAVGQGEMKRIPRYPRLFRFPYGTCSRESLDALANSGLAAIQWSIVTGDPARGQTAGAIANQILRGVEQHRGAIVIAHANGRGWNTAGALPQVIPVLLSRGYRFVTVSELLAAGQPIATETCYEVTPGDNQRYDRLFGKGTGD